MDEGAMRFGNSSTPDWLPMAGGHPPFSQCSPAMPWGIHLAIFANRCPRCGWVARTEPRASAGAGASSPRR